MATWVVALALVATHGAIAGPPPPAPQTFLIYLSHQGEPIVVSRYAVEDGQVVFEKYGGQVRIPVAEVLRIVPDVPDAPESATLPAATPPAINAPAVAAGPPSRLYLAMRGGGDFRVTGLAGEGDRVRVSAAAGSFTVHRSDILGLVRLPAGAELPEAWLSIERRGGSAPRLPVSATAPVPAAGSPLPYQSSDRPHRLRLANGQILETEAFWVEDGLIRFRRLGGMVAISVSEIAGLVPRDTAPVDDRMAARYLRRLGQDLLEVQARGEPHEVRLAGVEMVDDARTLEDPWRRVERGAMLSLEFDRQRDDGDGCWLAYVFLPDGRMLNGELVRAGLARPRATGGNVRYLDLFAELASRALTR
jgi:hypothetical protein